jgi:hypothetical protein
MLYVVTPTGPLGFQVTATDVGTDELIGDFASLAEAQVFAAAMREIDAGQSHVMASKELC